MSTSKVLLLVSVIFLAVACNSNSALNYHQKIIEIENNLLPEITEAESKVTEYYKNENFTGISKRSAKIQKLIKEKISDLKNLEEPDAIGIEEYKKEAIDYFSFLRKIYVLYQKFGDAETEEDRQLAINEFQTINEQKLDVIESFKLAQKKFAKNNKFELKLQKKSAGDEEETKPKKKNDEE